MDLQKIKGLIDLLAGSPLAELELIEGEEKIRLVKAHGRGRAAAASLACEDSPATTLSPSTPHDEAEPAKTDKPAVSSTALASVASGSRLICAPMFGVVHLTPAPGEAPFVNVGDAVEEGQVLCTIEAMKMFNALEAECRGTVADILVKPGDEVEAGQPLLRIE
ncbi:MAG: acetyl-CoA carboxylase biotin carboxyl carrier protein [Paraburkholderia sp.]|jgi:acetyl-CoA carboxylase biotin carboxyl carrier protein|uniref:acetyl-CoA carboxylase biotin carboxyl carrier protein n=1 Tax=Burkholderiaceae TaxID=119060 RepID=UPI0010F757BF|nr:acetyl-CoA carboxylase biotin carboxyl carrier protein [Burkholderia sp. 4M9327F10]